MDRRLDRSPARLRPARRVQAERPNGPPFRPGSTPDPRPPSKFPGDADDALASGGNEPVPR